MNSKVYISIILLIINTFSAFSQKKEMCTVSGLVRDAITREVLSFATIQLEATNKNGFYSGIADANGRYQIKSIPPGEYLATVSFLGYERGVRTFGLSQSATLSFDLFSSATALDEIVITATESKGHTSSSRIDRRAMEHLQPTSFSDLLELLPGGRSIDPNMKTVNLIQLREAGARDDILSSLGVNFMVDGASLNTDANLQYMPGYSKGENKESVANGVDMRTLSTDNIESVDIIRGIPSVEYGNLTGGLIMIKRKQIATPFMVRFKADQVGKIFSIGKGIALGGNNILNMDLSFLDSKTTPTNSNENYKRMTASVRWNANRKTQFGQLEWSINSDYTGSFDHIKRDKDATIKEDWYKSSYDKFTLGGHAQFKFKEHFLWRQIYANLSFSHELNKITEHRSVSIDRPTGIPHNWDTGEANGTYLPYHYTTDMIIDGKPLYANMKVTSDLDFKLASSLNKIKLGVDWNFSKNFGLGQVCDMTRPLNASSSLRPRKYNDIPGLHLFSFFAEERLELPISSHTVTLTGGIRGTLLPGLNKQYRLSEMVYIDPQASIQWTLPKLGTKKDWQMDLNIQVGWLSRMPTLIQIYPDNNYLDIAQLNYYHTNSDYRRLHFMTYKWNNTNYQLEPARNRKWEMRLGLAHKGHYFSVTYFEERMNNAFRELTYYKTMAYKKYDTSTIDATQLTNPPVLEDLNYKNDTLINTFSMQGNGARVRKKGIEFQYSSPRIHFLKTRFMLNGAWYSTITSNRMPKYDESSILINNEQLRYIGLYDWEDGTKHQRLSTNLMSDTYLKDIGMTISLSAQCTWFTSRQSLWVSGVPTAYIDQSGKEHIFTETDKHEPFLKHLLKTYSDSYFDRVTVPMGLDFNLKTTKDITKYVHLALFVNRIFSYYPTYKQGDYVIRRSSSPYFGMEANLTF